MADTIFWDCGTQFDLADIDGTLYVPGTETIRPRLQRLAEAARKRGVPRLCTVVTHQEGDADLATGKPDYKATFPVHCMAGTPGWQQIPETRCERPVEIPRQPHAERSVREGLKAYQAEILVEVAGFDPWANPAIATILEVLAPQKVVVYGIPADKMVAAVVNGLLERGVAVAIVEDAVKPFDAKAWDAARTAWVEKGVGVTDHRQLAG
jgi:nicotinamidase-related amidase